MQITEYFNFIKASITRHPIIQGEDTSFELKTSSAGVVKGRLSFLGNSRLEFAEYVVIKEKRVRKIKYRYTWLDEKGEVLSRWDNAPHYREVSTFPHHKHGSKGVSGCREPSLEAILNEIEKLVL